ncbi:C2H2 type zinc finger containing protein [Apiospora phragmitis]|uniref:C2H2 type zinc finger containing protein n=1 Tax=Apiospora phragmitis TaxID=2905665 RepID=A0ABR1VSE5_9PEZI
MRRRDVQLVLRSSLGTIHVPKYAWWTPVRRVSPVALDRVTNQTRPQHPPPSCRRDTRPCPRRRPPRRAARQSFYCELCSKGYSRMNDYEAHLSSYDHSHRQRMKDMKQMVKDPTAGARARKAEARADGIISIKLGAAAAGGGGDGESAAAGGSGNNNNNAGLAGGFKKGGFKKSGFKSAFAPVGGDAEDKTKDEEKQAGMEKEHNKKVLRDEDESDTENEGYEVYDPRHPTD